MFLYVVPKTPKAVVLVVAKLVGACLQVSHVQFGRGGIKW